MQAKKSIHRIQSVRLPSQHSNTTANKPQPHNRTEQHACTSASLVPAALTVVQVAAPHTEQECMQLLIKLQHHLVIKLSHIPLLAEAVATKKSPTQQA
jgi:hypothetical protein